MQQHAFLRDKTSRAKFITNRIRQMSPDFITAKQNMSYISKHL